MGNLNHDAYQLTPLLGRYWLQCSVFVFHLLQRQTIWSM